MRIIAGDLKGRRLSGWNKKLFVRPMTDRVKETLFNVLQPYFFEDLLFLDLFSGTGSLSLEALSRGASLAFSVEKNKDCIDIINKNAEILKDKSRLIIRKKDVFSFLKSGFKDKQIKEAFDIIVADPPFPLKLGEKLIKQLEKSPLCKKDGIFCIELSSKEPLKENYTSFSLFAKKDFGDKSLYFFRKG